jgi:hypothetical protein
MINVFLRLAVFSGMIVLSFGVLRTWWHALRAPRKALSVSPETRAEFQAREMAEAATRWVTAMEVAIAELGDPELWGAMERFSKSIGRLTAAVLADPVRYRRGRRYLGQILVAAEQAVLHFARHYRATGDDDTRERFLELTGELAQEYDRAAKEYAGAGADDLAIETEVLRELLRRHRL